MEFLETLDKFNTHIIREFLSSENDYYCEKILSHSLSPMKEKSEEYFHTIIFKDSNYIRIHRYVTRADTKVELMEHTSIDVEEFKQAYNCLQEQKLVVHNW